MLTANALCTKTKIMLIYLIFDKAGELKDTTHSLEAAMIWKNSELKYTVHILELSYHELVNTPILD